MVLTVQTVQTQIPVKPVFNNSKLAGYSCSNCNSYNDCIRVHCMNCNYRRESNLDIPCSFVLLKRTGDLQIHREGKDKMANNEMIELHAHFFNGERTAIKDLTDSQIAERRIELKKILFEAKARLTAHDIEEKERTAVANKERKAWQLTPGIDPSLSDRLAEKKTAKAKMSKGDKQLQTYLSLGIDEATARQMVAKILDAEAKKDYKTSVHSSLVTKAVRTETDKLEKNREGNEIIPEVKTTEIKPVAKVEVKPLSFTAFLKKG